MSRIRTGIRPPGCTCMERDEVDGDCALVVDLAAIYRTAGPLTTPPTGGPMGNIRGGVPGYILAMSTAQVVEAVEERDRLLEWSNSIANRMGDNFDGDESQEYIIDRWLDQVEERLRERDPAGFAWLCQSGPDPREDEEPVTR